MHFCIHYTYFAKYVFFPASLHIISSSFASQCFLVTFRSESYIINLQITFIELMRLKMSRMTAAHLKAGIIFGDNNTGEYVYLPASEIGMEDPLCVIETTKGQQDITLKQALLFVLKLSLKPVSHPRLGRSSF